MSRRIEVEIIGDSAMLDRTFPRRWLLVVATKRWAWWPVSWPLGVKTSIWTKRATRANVKTLAASLRELGAIEVTLAEVFE